MRHGAVAFGLTLLVHSFSAADRWSSSPWPAGQVVSALHSAASQELE